MIGLTVVVAVSVMSSISTAQLEPAPPAPLPTDAQPVVRRVPAVQPAAPINPSDAPIAKQSEYRLGAGDLIELKVYPSGDLEGEYRISSRGEILLPLVGRVAIAGKTIVNANAEIERRLADGFYHDPQVVARVKEYRSQRVSVLGAVNTAGAVVLYQPTRLLGVLSDAGGVRDDAGDRLVLVRQGSVTTSTQVQTIGLSQLLQRGDLRENVWVYPGDMVYVPHGDQVYLLGAVTHPGAYPYQEGMSLLKAISRAGGLKPTASQGAVNLIRNVNGVEKHRQIDVSDILDNEAPDVDMEPEDIVVIPEGFF